MLFATLPAIHEQDLLEEMVAHPSVDAVRYNTGQISPYSAEETIERLVSLTEEHSKDLWIDLKGRQLRITHWAYPRDGGRITLNHSIEVEQPAWMYFRGETRSQIREVQGNVVWVDPPPRNAVGEGQAVNIEAARLQIDGYLIDSDRRYLDASAVHGVDQFMLSFVEQEADLDEVRSEFGPDNPNFILKIESAAGVDFVRSSSGHRLMAARDDLLINVGPRSILGALEQIIQQDPDAICASRLFSSLERRPQVSMSDISDLELMRKMGYRHFMLSDGICRYHFRPAIEAWEQFAENGQVGS